MPKATISDDGKSAHTLRCCNHVAGKRCVGTKIVRISWAKPREPHWTGKLQSRVQRGVGSCSICGCARSTSRRIAP